jgi:flagellar protein FlaJ
MSGTTQTEKKKGGRIPAKVQVAALFNRYFIISLGLLAGIAALNLSYPFLLPLLVIHNVLQGVMLGGTLALAAFAGVLLIQSYIVMLERADAVMRNLELAKLKRKEKLSPVRSMTRYMLKRNTLKNFAASIERDMEMDVIYSGDIESPVVASATSVAFFIVALAVVAPAAIAATVILKSPLPLAAFAVPPLVLYNQRIKFRQKKTELSMELQDELPFFAVIATILTGAGLTLYAALRRAAFSPLFRGFYKEAAVVVRDVEFFGRTPLDALDQRVRFHPNRMWAWFVSGYSAIIRSGGSVENYLSERVREYLNWVSFRWQRYAEKTNFLGEMSILVFFMLPTFFLIMSAMGGANILPFLLFIPVAFGGLLYSMTISGRPRYPDTIKARVAAPAAAGAAVGVALAFLLPHTYTYASVAAGLLIFASMVTAQVQPQVRAVAEIEESAPRFVRDMTEFRKIGYDLFRSLQRAAEEGVKGAYKPGFNIVLTDFVNQVSLGVPLTRAVAKTGSWIGRFVFYVVQALAESGNVTPILLEQLTEFTNRLVEAKKQARALMRTYQMIGLITPVLLTFTLIITSTMLSSFSSNFGASSSPSPIGGGAPIPLFNLQITPLEYQLIFTFIILSSFVVGLLVSQALDGTPFNLVLSIIGVVIATISVTIFATFRPELTHLLPGGTGTP